MSLEIVTVPPELSLEAAHRIMLERSLRHLPVVSGQKLAGILSDRDLLLVIGRGRDGAFVYPKQTVGEVMSLSPISAGPSTSVAELAKAMLDAKIDAIPILTAQDVLIGLVTSTDLMKVLALLPKYPQPTIAFQVRRAADLHARA
ncbi:MAG: CBS domain-containing protein [Archangium sp.]|nr:CBS domain-containing protein [Archangium sp.]